MQENADQKQLRIWTFFTLWPRFHQIAFKVFSALLSFFHIERIYPLFSTDNTELMSENILD